MILPSTPCDDCTAQSCCAALDDCNADTNCLDCFTGNAMDPTACTMGATKVTLDALTACVQTSCAAACAPVPPTCNPVTNGGCAAGASCDFSGDKNMNTTFSCYMAPPPNTVDLCGACDDRSTACLGGLTCLSSQCAKFCCADGDCGSGVCAPTGSFGVGVCVSAASVDAGMPAPSCDAPATSPSQGTCVLGLDAGQPPADAGGTPSPPGEAGALPTDAGTG
jgi:hypothetical protein